MYKLCLWAGQLSGLLTRQAVALVPSVSLACLLLLIARSLLMRLQ